MTTIDPFTSDNTSGYTAAELAELNRRYEAALRAEFGDQLDDPDFDISENPAKSTADHLAERVQADFDANA